MEVVKYRPSDAIRWLQNEAGRLKTDAKSSGKSVMDSSPTDFSGFSETVKNAAGAVYNFGKSAYAELAHLRANASEYVLLEDHLDVVTGTSIKSVPYTSVRKIVVGGDKGTLVLEKGSVVIKPFAHIVAGPLKVPIGWQRNGLETPYHLIFEELAARCKVEIEPS